MVLCKNCKNYPSIWRMIKEFPIHILSAQCNLAKRKPDGVTGRLDTYGFDADCHIKNSGCDCKDYEEK